MSDVTRSKRKLEPLREAPASKKRSGLTNLTNFKSPQKVAEKVPVPTHMNPSVYLQRWVPQTQEVPESQSGELVASQEEAVDDQEKSLRMMRCVKRTLEKDFKNVNDRLQLQSTPPCLYDLVQCHKNHSKNSLVWTSSEKIYLAKSFLSEDRSSQFILYVRNSICGNKEFPGVEVVRGILELILKISPDSKSSQSLVELHSLFTSILATFPVCHLRDFYLQLLHSPIKVPSIQVSTERGILVTMLEMLTELISNDDADEKQLRQSISHEMLNNFYLWDQQCEEKSSFENFSREEKFSRIFIILDLLTSVLENDLAMFIIKFSRRLQSSIENENHRPLICAVLWQSYESVFVINSTIKSLIETFVNMVALKYPSENVRVVARLLNLVAQVTNLYEYPEETFEYPSYKSLTTDLVRSLQKAIETSPNYSVELFISVVEKLRTPLLKMLLANEIITKIHSGSSQPVSLEVPFDCIRRKDFKKFKEAPVTIPLKGTYVKFPVLDSKKKTKRCEVTQQNYLELLCIYTEAVNNFYRIQAALNEMNSTTNVKTALDSACSSFDFTNFHEKLLDVNLEEKVEIRSIDLNFKKLVHIKLSIETCTFYRNQIKFFMMLPKLIQKCHERYGEKFDGWMKLMKRMEK